MKSLSWEGLLSGAGVQWDEKGAAKMKFYELTTNLIPQTCAPLKGEDTKGSGLKLSLRRKGCREVDFSLVLGFLWLFFKIIFPCPSLFLIGYKINLFPPSWVCFPIMAVSEWNLGPYLDPWPFSWYFLPLSCWGRGVRNWLGRHLAASQGKSITSSQLACHMASSMWRQRRFSLPCRHALLMDSFTTLSKILKMFMVFPEYPGEIKKC